MMQHMQPHALRQEQRKRPSTRITVTFTPGDHEAVFRIAKGKRVSASWVVRDAVAKYITSEHAEDKQLKE
jgi:predicted transcriptional regulator